MQFIDPNTALSADQALTLENTADVLAQASTLASIHRVVLQFPKWTDGRAYTQARLLRTRLRYTGEIVACGEVVVDMVPLLARTGFSHAQLAPGQKPEHARAALGHMPAHYQGDVQQAKPLFARGVA